MTISDEEKKKTRSILKIAHFWSNGRIADKRKEIYRLEISFGAIILNDIKVRAYVWFIYICGVLKTHKWPLMLQFINKSNVPFNFITPSSSLLLLFFLFFFWCVCIDRLQVIYSLIMFSIIISPSKCSFMTLVEVSVSFFPLYIHFSLHFTINKLQNFIYIWMKYAWINFDSDKMAQAQAHGYSLFFLSNTPTVRWHSACCLGSSIRLF